MKIITFNIRCADDPNGHSVAERAPRLKTVLGKYDPDLIGFQEVTPRWMEILKKDYSDRYEMHYCFRDHGEWGEAEPLLWKKDKFRLLNSGSFWFSDTPELMSGGWDSMGCLRICSWVKLLEKESGKDFVWFNSHYGFSDSCQLASTKLLLDHVKTMAPNAAILTGDFNMRPDYPAYRRMTEVLADANELTAKNPRNTYHGYSDAPNPDRIDFCFVTPETAVPLSSHVIDDTVDGKYPSDHYGVLTTLELKTSETLFCLKVGEASSPHADAVTRSRRLRDQIRKQKASLVLLQQLPEDFMPRMERLELLGYGGYRLIRGERSFFAAWKNSYALQKHEELSDLAGGRAALTRLAMGKSALALLQADLCACTDPLAAVKALCAAAKEEACPAVLFVSGLAVGSEAHKLLRSCATDARTARGVDLAPTLHGFADPEFSPVIDDHLFLFGVAPTSYRVDAARPKGIAATQRDPILATITL